MADKTYPLSSVRKAWGAGMAQAARMTEYAFFHSWKPDGVLALQGRVVAELPNGKIVAQLYSWLDGEPTDRLTFTRAEADNWTFYRTEQEWRDEGLRLSR